MSDPITTLPTSTAYPPVQVWVTRPRPRRYWLHALLLVATIFTTLVVGSHFEYNFLHQNFPLAPENNSWIPFFPIDLIWHHPARLWLGVPFSASLMLILMAHEMGHYVYCVRYNVDATLPFFLPFPSIIGTMGAFIRIRSPIRSRTALFDIGIAGPIAGFIVACAVLMLSLGLSRAVPTLGTPPEAMHYPLIFPIMQHLLMSLGMVQGAAALPLPGLLLHPMAIAAWGGMLATSLNLLPGGQLDGGHIVYSMAPRAHRIVSRVVILALLPLAVYVWAGWLVWAVLLELSSFRHPEVGEWPKVSGKRLWLALCALFMLLVTLPPVPVSSTGENGRDMTSLRSMVRALRDK